jgi:hypothetical protein
VFEALLMMWADKVRTESSRQSARTILCPPLAVVLGHEKLPYPQSIECPVLRPYHSG